MVLHVEADVKGLFELGRTFPWPKLERCLSCGSVRIWGHGYVPRYFEGFLLPLVVKRLRCPDCRTVYTLRPHLFYRGFRYSLQNILDSLMAKIEERRWLPGISRQNQQYWFRGLRLQAFRFGNSLSLDAIGEIISRGLIPVSHSLKCEMLRL